MAKSSNQPSRLPYVKLYADDWVAAAVGLTPEEKGFLLRVVLCQWRRLADLPDDVEWLAGPLRCDKRMVRRLRDRLVAKGQLTAENGVLYSARTKHDIEEALAATSDRDRQEVSQKSPRSLPEVSEKLPEKPNVSNGRVFPPSPQPQPEPEKDSPSPGFKVLTDEHPAGAAAVEKLPSGTDGKKQNDGPRFARMTLKRIEGMGLEPTAMIERYVERTRRLRNKVKDPDAYLISIATEEASKRYGITVDEALALTSRDMAKRTEALLATTVGAMTPRKRSPELAALCAAQTNQRRGFLS